MIILCDTGHRELMSMNEFKVSNVKASIRSGGMLEDHRSLIERSHANHPSLTPFDRGVTRERE